uniref:iron-sulfur cluster formation ABC transporter n=1 Tax=Gloiopeltis furcata TaxID=42017 RepID=UPI0028D0F38A|nr:iron-sulfur cluster formation ABC transporter [Gloiopeltis furcata]WMP13877.1 iron-sulfur cluster formation ABC transporter [Gloiopeltis furcata]
MNHTLLKITNLHANIEKNPILKGVNLSINKGEIHAIMGTNGSGKSTLAKVIAGHPSYQVTQGSIVFDTKEVTYMEPEQRAINGLFLAFQYPVEIPGVSNSDFLRIAYNTKRKANSEIELDPLSFFNFISKETRSIKMDEKFLARNVNEGFSGGEKKKNEILQMTMLNSKLSILDEMDSGLDVDALKIISKKINSLANSNNAIVIITHYYKILEYIMPDYVHVMKNGKITHTGDINTAKLIEDNGYKSVY